MSTVCASILILYRVYSLEVTAIVIQSQTRLFHTGNELSLRSTQLSFDDVNVWSLLTPDHVWTQKFREAQQVLFMEFTT